MDGNERGLLVETRTPTTPTTTVSIDDCQERKGEYSKQKKAEKRVKTLYTCQTALQLIVVSFSTVCLLPFLLFLSVGRWRLLHKKLQPKSANLVLSFLFPFTFFVGQRNKKSWKMKSIQFPLLLRVFSFFHCQMSNVGSTFQNSNSYSNGKQMTSSGCTC